MHNDVFRKLLLNPREAAAAYGRSAYLQYPEEVDNIATRNEH